MERTLALVISFELPEKAVSNEPTSDLSLLSIIKFFLL